MNHESRKVQEVQQDFEKVALNALKSSIHAIALDAFSISATRFLQIMNVDMDSLSNEMVQYLSMQQMTWEDLNKAKSSFFKILADLGKTAPVATSSLEDKRDFAHYCEGIGFIELLSNVMSQYGTFTSTRYESKPQLLPVLKSVDKYIDLREAQLEATKAQFIEDVAHRWGLKPDTLAKTPYTSYQALVERDQIQEQQQKPEVSTRNRIQQLLEFPDEWLTLMASLPSRDLMGLEDIIINGSLQDTARAMLRIANETKQELPDFPLFKTYLRLYGQVKKNEERTEEHRYFEDFLYAIWKENFINTVITLRDVGLDAAKEVWNQMYEGLDINTDMLVAGAEETQIMVQLEQISDESLSLDDIRNQFMDQFLADEIPGVCKAVRGFIETLLKENNEPIRIEMARAFRMTESSINIAKQGQLKTIAKICADALESSKADFTWIRKHKGDVESVLKAIESLRLIALEKEVLTLEKIEELDSIQAKWETLATEVEANKASGPKKEASPAIEIFKDDSGTDFFGDLTDSLADDLGSLDLDILDTE